MKHSLAVAGLGFTIIVIGTAAAMLHPTPQALFMAAVPSAHEAALMLAAMTFVVAAVLEHDR